MMSFKKDLMSKVLENEIINIYLNDGKKIVIGEGGYKKQDVTYEEYGFSIKMGPVLHTWYSYANIKQIDVFTSWT